MSRPKDSYTQRFYREGLPKRGLVSFNVTIGETDLFILANSDLSEKTSRRVIQLRQELDAYIAQDLRFLKSLNPIEPLASAPDIVRTMCDVTKRVDVGPMASVAGAIAHSVGMDLCADSKEVLVENGGDLFLKVAEERTVALYAGEDSPFSMKLGLKVKPDQTPLGICTSSGTVGPSLSFGKTDAAVIIAKDTALADAAASGLGNRVQTDKDIGAALEWSRTIEGILGAVVLIGDKLGAWGILELVRI